MSFCVTCGTGLGCKHDASPNPCRDVSVAKATITSFMAMQYPDWTYRMGSGFTDWIAYYDSPAIGHASRHRLSVGKDDRSWGLCYASWIQGVGISDLVIAIEKALREYPP